MTRKFIVIKKFRDLSDGGHVYGQCNTYPREGVELDEARADTLASGDNDRKEKFIVEVLTDEHKEKLKELEELKKAKKDTKTKGK